MLSIGEVEGKLDLTSKVELTVKVIKEAVGELGKQVHVHDTLHPNLKLSISRKSSDGAAKKSLIFLMKHRGEKIHKELLQVWDGLKKPDIDRCRDICATWRASLKAGKRPDELIPEDERPVTYGELLELYCDRLKAEGKQSSEQVRSDIHRHIRDKFPAIWKRPSNQITREDCIKPCSGLLAEGKFRTQDKLRSYQISAFNMALEVKASRPNKLINLGIMHNPTDGWKKEVYQRADKSPSIPRPLLLEIWQATDLLPDERCYTAKLWILFCGQRIAQMQRITWDDVVISDRSFVNIRDLKGRGGTYVHELPVTQKALDIMKRVSSTGYVFSRNRGRDPIHDRYFDDIMKELRRVVDIPVIYTPKAIRATITTELSKLKVTTEIRNSLQSRYRGTVEDRHYQGYDFYDEKLDGVTRLERLLDGRSLV